jgi:hypothetical protein
MIYLSVGNTDGGTYREIEIDQFQAEALVESLKNLNTGFPQIKRLVEFVDSVQKHVDQEVKMLNERIAQDQTMLSNITYRPE